MFETRPSRSGRTTASFRGKSLHSTFDPEKEADRFVDSQLNADPNTVVVIGPALGYICDSLLRRYPGARVFALHLSDETASARIQTDSVVWQPSAGEPAQFLSASLDEIECASLQVCEWPPAVECFPEEAKKVRDALESVVRRHIASLATEGANGRRWISNLCRNFVGLAHPLLPSAATTRHVKACVLIAAGPSLEQALPTIRNLRSQLAIWVVGSALDAVMAANIMPDLAISADPAMYAAEYLREARRVPVPVAGPLTGARGFADITPVWPLQTGDGIEDVFWSDIDPPPSPVPAHGTVTGTALNLALSTSSWPVVLAGLDFAWHELRDHGRPHVAETYRRIAERRFSPYHTQQYGRWIRLSADHDSWRSSDDLMIYKHWFEQRGGHDRRVFRLLPSPIGSATPEITPDDFAAMPKKHPEPELVSVEWPTTEQRRVHVRHFLDSLQQRLETKSDPVSGLLLRRLALDGLLRYTRSNDPSEWSAAVEAARDRLSGIRSLVS